MHPFRLFGIFLFLTVTMCGCSLVPSHIHDADRAARTAQLAGLVNAYGEKSPGIYDTLLQSARTIAAEQDKVLAGLGANRTDAVGQMLPFKTGASLGKEHSTISALLDETQSQLKKDVYTYLREKAAAEDKEKHAAEAITAAKAKVKEAQQNVTNWNATLAVLETGVAELPSISQSTSDSKQAGLDALQKQLQAAGDKEIQYVDATGATQTRKIRDILKDQINLTGDGKPLLNLPDAPGATLTILMLGVDLAQVEKQAAEAKLTQLSRRLQLYERVQAEIMLAYALLSDVENLEPIVLPNESFLVRVQLLTDEARANAQAALEVAKSANNEKEDQRQSQILPQIQKMNRSMTSLVARLIALRELAIAGSIATRTSLDLQVAKARLAHEESILDSQVNDIAWRAVIRSGVVVLDQYEQGGFTAQDAANIISIAQAIAVGVIAGRVQ